MTQPSPQSGVFFVSGGTLAPDVPSYVVRTADQEFLDRLAAGEFCYVLTSRQMGKSSLMARTAVKLRDAGVLTAIIDLTSIGEGSQERPFASTWYLGIARAIAGELKLKADLRNWWQERDGLPEQQRFTEFLEDLVLGTTSQRIVIFVDEIDRTLSLPFADDFFAGLRACYNARATKPVFARLTFALLGVASPSKLIKDAGRTPFNIGQRIPLNGFTPDEAARLAAGLPLEGTASRQALERVLGWTGGQPYLTQMLCAELRRRLVAAEMSGVRGPPGFGVRQAAAALTPDGLSEERQRTAALQDAGAPAHAPAFEPTPPTSKPRGVWGNPTSLRPMSPNPLINLSKNCSSPRRASGTRCISRTSATECCRTDGGAKSSGPTAASCAGNGCPTTRSPSPKTP